MITMWGWLVAENQLPGSCWPGCSGFKEPSQPCIMNKLHFKRLKLELRASSRSSTTVSEAAAATLLVKGLGLDMTARLCSMFEVTGRHLVHLWQSIQHRFPSMYKSVWHRYPFSLEQNICPVISKRHRYHNASKHREVANAIMTKKVKCGQHHAPPRCFFSLQYFLESLLFHSLRGISLFLMRSSSFMCLIICIVLAHVLDSV